MGFSHIFKARQGKASKLAGVFLARSFLKILKLRLVAMKMTVEAKMLVNLRRKCARRGMKLVKARSRKDKHYLGEYYLINERGILLDENKHVVLARLAERLAGS